MVQKVCRNAMLDCIIFYIVFRYHKKEISRYLCFCNTSMYASFYLGFCVLVANFSCLSSKDNIMTQKDGQKAKVEASNQGVHRSVGYIVVVTLILYFSLSKIIK